MGRTPLPHRGLAVWFTGLSGAGKTTLCRALKPELRGMGYPVQKLDGDDIRKHLSRDLGYSKVDRGRKCVSDRLWSTATRTAGRCRSRSRNLALPGGAFKSA